jgi:exosortase/archaeosortase family protein
MKRINFLSLRTQWHSWQHGPYAFVLEIGLFMLITFAFHKFWWAFANQIKSLAFIQWGADTLATEVYRVTYWLNAKVFALPMTEEGWNTMRFANGKALLVAESCSGLKQFFQIAILFVIYPGPWKHKTWFIPLGFVAIHLTNIFRVLVLSLWMAHDVPYWDFSHDWIMRPFYYVVIFGLWYIWNERIRHKHLKKYI